VKKLLLLSGLIWAGWLSAQSENVAKDTTVQRLVEEAKARTGAPPVDTAWKVGGNLGLQFSQAAYQNWQAGGVNSLAGNSLVNLFANYDAGGSWNWNNSAILAYGLNFQDTIFNKTDDRIELESRLDYHLSKKLNLSAMLNFRSQFMPGFANPGETADSVKISDFLAPGYVLSGLGLTWKPNAQFTAYLSPVTAKTTIVRVQRLADAGAFGVDSGKTVRLEIGGYLNLAYNRQFTDDIKMQFRMDLFSNYAEDPSLIDVNSELLVFFSVNRFITANVALAYLYDHDVKFDLDNNANTPGVPRSQWRQILSLGFTYNFGDPLPKKK